MKYLFPLDNLLTAATGYTPTGGSINTRTIVSKTGGGVVTLTGDGVEDATYDIEVVNNTIVGTPTVSTPVYTGVGNPVMSLLAASGGTAAQRFGVTLVDLGTDTTNAFTPWQGVTLQAVASGSGGNSIAIEVDESGIVRTGTDYALLEAITRDANEYVGDAWNFGAPTLNPDGTIPSSAPRISFGADPQVYRQYREYVDGRYVYRFSPAPVRDVQEGARVYAVTGSRTVTTDNGATVRTYASVTTLYSLLTAIIADASRHVDVVGAVTNDLSPGGMAMVEMAVRTVSYVQSIERDGTVFVRGAELDIDVTDDAPTELLTITCKRSDYIGAELWEVRGTVSGELADAVTNVAYDGTDYDFTIPQLLAPNIEPVAEKSAVLDLVTRDPGDPLPKLCVENFVLGADARDRVFTYRWTQRATECTCEDVEIDGGPDGDILGTEEDYVGELIPVTLQTRVQSLYNWRNTFVASQASILAGTTAVTSDDSEAAAGTVATDVTDVTSAGADDAVSLLQRTGAVVKVDRVDIKAANKAVALLHSTLVNIYETNGETMPGAAGTAWDSALTDLQTDFAALSTLVGSNFWRTWSAFVSGSTLFDEDAKRVAEGAFSSALLTADFDGYIEKWRARMDYVLTIGGVSPDFEGSTRPGNDVWQDEGGTAWFESQNGLLPIQPGHYYYSSVLDEEDIPVATREFGIGVGIGCEESLRDGDQLIITISASGNVRVTYQVGDQFRVRVVNGSAIQLGGGQTGTDTQTWRVLGSVAGALADYSLYKPTPGTYSTGGLTFKITPGGINSALGDEFEFYVEGGQFRWRKNAGSWSANTQIAATVAIDAPISAQFDSGAAPSWVIGDSYNFRVQALHTLERVCSPVHSTILGSGELRIAYTAAMLAGTTPTWLYVRNNGESDNEILRVRLRDVGEALLRSVQYTLAPGDHAIDITADISAEATATMLDVVHMPTAFPDIGLLWLGEPFELELPTGAVDPGVTKKRIKLGTPTRSKARLGATIQHSAVAESAFADFLDRLNDAAVNHEGRFAVVWPAGTQSECGIVKVTGDELEVEDEFDFQPTDNTDRLLKFQLSLEPVA